MKAAYQNSSAFVNLTSNGTMLLMEVDKMTGKWITSSEGGHSVQVGLEVCCPAVKREECEMVKGSELESLQKWGSISRQPAMMAASNFDTNQQTPSPASSFEPMIGSPGHSFPFVAETPCSNLAGRGIASSTRTSRDLTFPARRQRENTFESAVGCNDDTSEANVPEKFADLYRSPPRPQGKSNCSFADLYVPPKEICLADVKDSTVFSKGTVTSSTEEVIFPKRKNRADRNAWRDWTNTGYAHLTEDYDQEPAQAWSPPISGTTAVNSASAERFRILNAEEFSTAKPENSVSLSCDNSCVPETFSKDRGRSTDATQSVPIAEVLSTVDFPAIAEGTGCLYTSRKQQRDADGQKLSPRFRGVRCKQRRYSERAGKYPPPLESLSRHKSQRPSNQMPWVQLQHIRSQGRFMLQEVEVTQPVVFQPIRKNGRLVLHLLDQDEDEDVENSMPVRSSVTEKPAASLELAGETRACAVLKDAAQLGEKKADEVPAQSQGRGEHGFEAQLGRREADEAEAEAQLEERKKDEAEFQLEVKKAEEVETCQLLENLTLPRKEKRKKAAKVWPESRESMPSFAVTAEWMGQKVEETSSAVSSAHRLDNMSTASFRPGIQDRAVESKPSLAVYESIIRDSFLSFTTAHSFLRSLLGEPNPNRSDFASKPLGGKSAFLCAEGIGKSHHGNRFCHQSPCVS